MTFNFFLKFRTNIYKQLLFFCSIFILSVPLIFTSAQGDQVTSTSQEEIDQINAGLLSDIWFSKIDLNYEDELKIYGSFQNTSDKNIKINYSFFIDENEISKNDVEIANNSIVKIGTDWRAEAGEFDVRLFVDEVTIDNVRYNSGILLRKESNLKVKITREIDIEYIKEMSSSVYQNTISEIDDVAMNLNDSLQNLKIKKTNSQQQTDQQTDIQTDQQADEQLSLQQTGSGLNDTNGETSDLNNRTVIGSNEEFNNKELPEGQVAGFQFSNENVLFDWKNNLGDSLRNFAISALQFIIYHWKFLLVVIISLIIFILFKNKFTRKID